LWLLGSSGVTLAATVNRRHAGVVGNISCNDSKFRMMNRTLCQRTTERRTVKVSSPLFFSFFDSTYAPPASSFMMFSFLPSMTTARANLSFIVVFFVLHQSPTRDNSISTPCHLVVQRDPGQVVCWFLVLPDWRSIAEILPVASKTGEGKYSLLFPLLWDCMINVMI